jgi:hypothetical protein
MALSWGELAMLIVAQEMDGSSGRKWRFQRFDTRNS